MIPLLTSTKSKCITVQELRENRSLQPNLRGELSPLLTGEISLNLRGVLSPELRGWISPLLTGEISPLLTGEISPKLTGNLSGVYGDVTGVEGNLDACKITAEERKTGVDIQTLVKITQE